MSKFTDFLKNNKNDIFKPIIVLLCICIIIPLALSLTNKLTADRIEELRIENENAQMSNLIKADKFESFTFTGKDKFEFNIAKDKDGKPQGYIFVTSAKGYGGEVSVMTAIGTDGKVKDIAILDATSETPGLGQNVTKESFYSQFSGKSGEITVVKNNADSKSEVNAVTGATISSRAVKDAVNKALANYSEYSNATSKDTEVGTNEK
jgi:electron transport complex protein RnfG